MRNKRLGRNEAPDKIPPGYVRDQHGNLRMTRKEAARQRRLADALRPKKPPSDREIIQAREKRYHFYNDLVTEGALKASLPKHPHPLDVMEDGCSWCGIERRIFAKGHMASLRPQPAWWKRFVADSRGKKSGVPRQWTDLKITRSDGRWWVVRVTESLDLHEPGTGEAEYKIEPVGGGMTCSAKEFGRLNVRRLERKDAPPTGGQTCGDSGS